MRYILFAQLIVMMWTGAFAQEPDPKLPENVEISSGEVGVLLDFHQEFLAESDEIISVVVRTASNSVDPVVTLQSPEGETLAYNDNHSSEFDVLGPYDAFIEYVELETTGLHMIEVTNNFWSLGEVEVIILYGEEITLDFLTPVIDTLPNGTSTGTIASTGPCTVQVGTIPARLRFQPTLKSKVARLLYPGHSLEVDGFYQREGTMVWYRVAEYLYVREDAIILGGECDELPPL